MTGPARVITIIEPESESVTVIPEAPGPARVVSGLGPTVTGSPARRPTEARRTRSSVSESHDPADHYDPRSETPEDSAPGHPTRSSESAVLL